MKKLNKIISYKIIKDSYKKKLCNLDFKKKIGDRSIYSNIKILINFQLLLQISQMQYLAAYALASLSGKNAPTEADLNRILSATGQKFSDDEIKKVVTALKGKKIEDVIKSGLGKVGSVQASSGSTTTAAKTEKPKEQKKDKKAEVKAPEPPKPEPKKEQPVQQDFGAGDLFGDF